MNEDRRMLDVIDMMKSRTEIFIPPHASGLFDVLRVGTYYTMSMQLFESGIFNLTVRAYVRDKDTIEFQFDHPNGERLGIMFLRRSPYGPQFLKDDQ